MGQFDEKTTVKQLNLSRLLFTVLILISLVPLSTFFLFTQKELVSELNILEEEQQVHHMEDELDVLMSKIESYKNMINFASQLPAVLEILDKGKHLSGAINQKMAYDRYSGVLSRAFKTNNDVISIHILDLKLNIRFSLMKNPETTQYHRIFNSNWDFNPDLLAQTLQLKDKGFLISPLLLSKENWSQNTSSPKLFLRIFTPIVLKKEIIGVFCSDIDIGLLTRSYPGFHWVLKDGSYLFHADHDENAFLDFPGLEKIFISDKAGVLRTEHAVMAWMPFLKGKDVSLALWGGKSIALTAVQAARHKLFVDVLKIFLILLTILIFISFWISRYTKRVSAQFLENLRQSIFHQHKAFQGPKKRIRELSEFYENISYILDQNILLEKKRQKTLADLQKSLDEVSTLRGILPICSFCKSIRNDQGYYERIEAYIHKHSGADFSHTICPKCMKKHYPDE